MHGCYGNLIGESSRSWGAGRVWELLTGGISSELSLSIGNEAAIWSTIERYHIYQWLASAGTRSSPDVEANGLTSFHAYSILGTTTINITTPSTIEDSTIATTSTTTIVRLVRLRNPWAAGEWSGDWSDTSEKWNLVDTTTRHRLSQVKDDGCFWYMLTPPLGYVR